jgi:transcriptional regulator with XRE-family HTH domain
MSRRGVFDGGRQEEALRALLVREPDGLKTRSGKTLTEVAQEVGLSYGQLWRYISGGLPLRSDQFPAFAQALETTEGELVRSCFPAVVKDDTTILRALLEAADIDGDRVRDALAEVEGKHFSQAILRHAAEVVIEAAEQQADQRRRAAN